MVVSLQNIELQAHHGVFEEERKEGNLFRVSVSMHVPDTPAMTTDRLEDTVNYACLYDIVRQQMQQPSNLLEHVAARIRTAIAGTWHEASDIHVSVSKHNPPVGGKVEWATVEI